MFQSNLKTSQYACYCVCIWKYIKAYVILIAILLFFILPVTVIYAQENDKELNKSEEASNIPKTKEKNTKEAIKSSDEKPDKDSNSVKKASARIIDKKNSGAGSLSRAEKKVMRQKARIARKEELEIRNEVEGFGLGFEFIEPIVQLADPIELSIPLNLLVSYAYLWNFEIIAVTKTFFPKRGGFFNATLVGLRIHSSRKYGSSVFLGLSVGWAFTNVPWFDNGFQMEAYAGYRYLFKFRMYLDGGAGGRFKITANKMEPLFFLSLGYII